MTEKRRYDREFLERFCKDNDIKYENIDESVNITRDLHIKGNCKTENCDEKFDKTFRRMIENGGPYCVKCSTQNKLYKSKETNLDKYGVENPSQSCSIKQKKKDTCMKNFGVEHALHSEDVKDRIKKTCLEKYGVENVFQSEEVKDRIKKTCLEKYGVKYPTQSQEVRENTKQTCLERYGVECNLQLDSTKEQIKCTNLERYGVEHTLQSSLVKEKSKQKCLEKYGVENPFQSDDVKERIKKTCFERYGVEYSSQSEEVKEKIKQTCLEKYGVEYSSQSHESRDKVKQTCLEKYGVENHMQNSEIAERASKSAYNLKDYTYPSGKVIKCQGYEPFALNILISDHFIAEEDIVTSRKEVPEIWYKYSDNKDHRYYVDIFIKSLNKFIEVKSTWTYKKNMEKVELTKNTVKEKGFLYECWVFDGKGNIVETIQ